MMKKNQFAVLAILTSSLFSAAAQALAATQAFDGIISDSMCSKKHMMPGKSDAQCIKECIKTGSTYVLVVGDKTYSLKGKMATIEPFAGKHVQVKGDVNQNAINVTDIHEAKGGSHAGMKM
jgi:hypothetical protein